MKKLTVAAAVLVWSGAAFAGDYHQSSTLKCSECHTMHASRAHGLQSANAGDDLGWAAPAFPNDKLLIQAGVNVTCLACHDAQTDAPDVFAENQAGSPAFNARSAGALSGTVTGHTNTGYETWMGHTLGDMAAPPGFTGATWDPGLDGFHCGNCHSIHGSAYFRNLGGTNAGTAAQKASGAFTGIGPAYNALVAGARVAGASDDVFINAPAATEYATNNVKFLIGTGAMNKYCAVCHGDFHNVAGNNQNTVGATGFIRHPTSGVGLGSTTALPATPEALNGAILARPAYNAVVAPTGAEAACLSCHKGHGNQRGYGLVYPNLAAADTDLENGNTAADAVTGLYPIRNLCTVCHAAY